VEPDEFEDIFDLRKLRRKKRLLETSIGLIEIEFVGERWGVVTHFDQDGRVQRQVDFNERQRGLGQERGLRRSLHEIGVIEGESELAREVWDELSSPTEWPPPRFFAGVIG
jgi:hypothetical protein